MTDKAPLHHEERPWRNGPEPVCASAFQPVPMERRMACGTKSPSGLFDASKLPPERPLTEGETVATTFKEETP